MNTPTTMNETTTTADTTTITEIHNKFTLKISKNKYNIKKYFHLPEICIERDRLYRIIILIIQDKSKNYSK